ncbi:MAG: addiction module protein [Spirochaetales bacterium]|nr:addiction module protein [Spirochaetales bacterium]
MITVNQILKEAKRLPDDQRLSLAHQLLMLGEPQFSEDIENSWDMEIRDRIAQYDRGEIQTRSAEDVFSDIDRKLQI